jgi:hypothetical protein
LAGLSMTVGRCEGLISVLCSQEEAKYEALEYLFEVLQSSSEAVKAYVCIIGPVAELQSLTVLSDDADPSSLPCYKKAIAGDVRLL